MKPYHALYQPLSTQTYRLVQWTVRSYRWHLNIVEAYYKIKKACIGYISHWQTFIFAIHLILTHEVLVYSSKVCSTSAGYPVPNILHYISPEPILGTKMYRVLVCQTNPILDVPTLILVQGQQWNANLGLYILQKQMIT